METCMNNGCRKLKRVTTYDADTRTTTIKTICEECGRTVTTATLTDEQTMKLKTNKEK